MIVLPLRCRWRKSLCARGKVQTVMVPPRGRWEEQLKLLSMIAELLKVPMA